MTPRARLALASLAITAGLGLLTASPTFAAPTHLFKSAFNASDAPEESIHPIAYPWDIAVDNSGTSTDGTVYVSDLANVVDRFNASGSFLSQIDGSETLAGSFRIPFGIAVDSSGNLDVGDYEGGVVDKFDSSGKLVKAFGEDGQISGAKTLGGYFNPYAIAVDPKTGELFISDIGHENVIDVFSPSCRYERQFESNGTARGLAIDSQGNLFAANGSEVNVYVAATGERNTAYGEGLGVLDSGGSNGVAVDPANDDVYVADSEYVAQYDKNGKKLSTFGFGHLSGAIGIGVSDSAKTIYVSNPGGTDVVTFGPLVTAPTPTTGETTEITRSTATLTGTVNPEAIKLTESCPPIR